MPTAEEQHQKLARLTRLRKLGVRRGAHDWRAPAAPPLRPTGDAAARSGAERPAGDPLPPNPQPAAGTRQADASAAVAPPAWPPGQAEATPGQATQPVVLPGEAVETPDGPAWVRTVRFPLAERPDLAALLEIEADALAAAGRDPTLARLDPARAAFVDTETTGLTPDAATYTFLISVGMYENLGGDAGAGGEFVVRQFFMRTPAEERGQLHLAAGALERAAGLVSFNGRAFDLPLLQNRFVLARQPCPWLRLPHLDLLPAARRIWRGRLESCRLGSLEQHILNVQRTADDVPGFLIPDIYRQYCLTGVIGDLLPRVFYHNLMDIVSMPLLAARLAQLYRAAGRIERLAGLHGTECLGLARAYGDLGWSEAAEAAYRAALAGGLSDIERSQAYRDLGYLLKHLDRRPEAAAIWEEWISAAPAADLTPYIELAKYHEWHTGDLKAARGWAAWALRLAEERGLVAIADDLRRRLERLEHKLTGQPVAPAAR